MPVVYSVYFGALFCRFYLLMHVFLYPSKEKKKHFLDCLSSSHGQLAKSVCC